LLLNLDCQSHWSNNEFDWVLAEEPVKKGEMIVFDKYIDSSFYAVFNWKITEAHVISILFAQQKIIAL